MSALFCSNIQRVGFVIAVPMPTYALLIDAKPTERQISGTNLVANDITSPRPITVSIIFINSRN